MDPFLYLSLRLLFRLNFFAALEFQARGKIRLSRRRRLREFSLRKNSKRTTIKRYDNDGPFVRTLFHAQNGYPSLLKIVSIPFDIDLFPKD